MTDQPKPATARDELLQLMAQWMLTTGRGSREHADRILNRHAHELAEQQREWLRSQGYDFDCVCGGCTCCIAREYIDLIDPAMREPFAAAREAVRKARGDEACPAAPILFANGDQQQ